jgi:hypothetical protein
MPRSTQSRVSGLRIDHDPTQTVSFSPGNAPVYPSTDVPSALGFPAGAVAPTVSSDPAQVGVIAIAPPGTTTVIGQNAAAAAVAVANGSTPTLDFITGMANDMQGIVDTTVSSLGGASSGNNLTDLAAAATSIPPTNVTGVLGAPDIGSSVQTVVDGVVQGVNTQNSTGNSVADLSSGVGSLATLLGWDPSAPPASSSVAGIAAYNALYMSRRAVTKPSYIGVDPSGDPVFNFSHLQGATLPTISVTSSTSAIGIIGTPDAGIKQSVAWIGSWTTNITCLVINIYQINTATNVATLLFSSPNIISVVPTAMEWNYYNIPALNWINSGQGSYYAVELAISGTGTYTLAGLQHQAPTNPNVFPSQLGADQIYQPAVPGGVGAGAGFPTFSGTFPFPLTGPPTTLSFLHTPNAGDNGVVVYVQASANPAVVTPPTAATYGGVAMTLQGSKFNNATTTDGELWGYVLTDSPLALFPTGPQTVLITFGGAVKPILAQAESQSFSNVGGFDTAQSVAGSAAAWAQSVTGTTGEVISQAFGYMSGTTTISTGTGYNRTQIYNQGLINTSETTTNGLLMGYATGSASAVSFTAAGGQVAPWAAMAIPVIGKTPTPSSMSLTYSPNVPFFLLCGVAGVSQQAPDTIYCNTSGTYTVPIWMITGDFFDIILIGSGAGGAYLANGGGGNAGAWTAITLVYGVDIPLSTTTFTVTTGAGSPGMGYANPAVAGGNTTITIPGYGTLTAAGGAPGNGLARGNSPGNEVFGPPGPTLNTTYFGGAAAGTGVNGHFPGGGGGEGVTQHNPYFGYITGQTPGGNGASGAAWITAYQ